MLTPQHLNKQMSIFDPSSNHPQNTNPTPSFFHQNINQGLFLSPLTGRCLMDESCLRAWSLFTTPSPSSDHYPQLSLIHPPSTGITQPKSNIHLVNDREWAACWRAAQAEFDLAFSGYGTTPTQLYFFSCVPQKLTLNGFSAWMPWLWTGSDGT